MSNFAFVTGTGSLIGLHRGKILGYSTRTKRCAVCEVTVRNGSAPRKHDCRKNWTGSSKAMEPDVAAELTVSASQHHVQVKILVRDEDSSTIKKVTECVSHDVEKWLDIVQTKRSFGTSLYAQNYKGILSVKVINYLLTCFGYAKQG